MYPILHVSLVVNSWAFTYGNTYPSKNNNKYYFIDKLCLLKGLWGSFLGCLKRPYSILLVLLANNFQNDKKKKNYSVITMLRFLDVWKNVDENPNPLMGTIFLNILWDLLPTLTFQFVNYFMQLSSLYKAELLCSRSRI